MALFTDGPMARIDDLRAYESAVLDVASAEGIDVSAKLRIAQVELGTELIPVLTRRAAGMARDLSNVVVTDPMVTAHVLRTLEAIYRDLYQSRMNDRYEGKWREYSRQSSRALQALLEAGIGVASAPIPKPAAATVSAVAGGFLPARTYYVRVAWTRDGRTTGELSETASLSIPTGSKLRIVAPAAPAGIAGWAVYAGTDPEAARRQNDAVLEPGAPWIEDNSGLRDDLTSWPVQRPDFYVENRRELLRG